jgi:AraC family transcriptional regulator, regulatory protein of adaptative response / methylated-DNA-[protein]-cysteine methyltransferase
LFKRHLGATPSEIAATRRVQIAKQLISDTSMPLSEIAFEAGFRSIRRFNDAFRVTYKRNPTSFRRARGVDRGVSLAVSASASMARSAPRP